MRKQELFDLFLSWLTISLAFSWVNFFGSNYLDYNGIFARFPIYAIAVGFGFILHELAHRFVAKKFHAHAYYKAWPYGLLFVLLSSFVGFIFAAPGAVYIHGEHIDARKNALISLAGPLTNIILAIIFAFFYLAFPIGEFLRSIGGIGFIINVWLALFNLIPVGPLDGRKVFVWKPLIWGGAMAITIVLFLLSSQIRI